MNEDDKGQFIGAKFPQAEFREFGIRAAERGRSKSALLRELALDFLQTQRAAGTRRTSAGTESASRRSTPRRRNAQPA